MKNWRKSLACAVIVAPALIDSMSFGQTAAWPTVRHDNHRSGRSPIVASPIDEPRFSVNYLTCCGSAVPSAPVAGADGTVYMSTLDTLWAIDGATGQPLWSVDDAGMMPTLMPDGAIVTVNYNAPDISSPAFVKAFEPDGTLRWEWIAPHPGSVFQVIVAPGGVIYGIYSGHVSLMPLIKGGFRFALDANGNQLWHEGGTDIRHPAYPLSLGDDGAIFMQGEFLAAADDMPKLCRVDPANGDIVWFQPQTSGHLASNSVPLLLDNGLVVIGLGKPFSWYYNSFITAFDQKTGAKVWEIQYDDPFPLVESYFHQPVILSNGEILSFWDKMYRISPSGQEIATLPFPDEMFSAWGPCPPPCPADLNDDGTVNVDDLLLVINNWS